MLLPEEVPVLLLLDAPSPQPGGMSGTTGAKPVEEDPDAVHSPREPPLPRQVGDDPLPLRRSLTLRGKGFDTGAGHLREEGGRLFAVLDVDFDLDPLPAARSAFPSHEVAYSIPAGRAQTSGARRRPCPLAGCCILSR